MDKHSPSVKAAIRQMANTEARRRAAAVAKFGVVIALSITIALVLFSGHRIPLQ